jgi:hypothetical protein
MNRKKKQEKTETAAESTKRDLRKLRRSELLEIMLAQSREIDDLKKQVADLEARLNDREIRKEKAGSLAEASLQVTKIFEEAQKAADIYLENIRDQGKEQK